MRNWNLQDLDYRETIELSFEPTYEELKLKGEYLLGKKQKKFWAYLWGIETKKSFRSIFQTFKFWAYLWGIETSFKYLFCFLFPRFEPTYEELKQPSHLKISVQGSGFWAYLWGIETCFFFFHFLFTLFCFEPTYEELKPCFSRLSRWAHSLFWAYLWGIETLESRRKWVRQLGFEPTYEELKLRFIARSARND